jgi:hypothetical protein
VAAAAAVVVAAAAVTAAVTAAAAAAVTAAAVTAAAAAAAVVAAAVAAAAAAAVAAAAAAAAVDAAVVTAGAEEKTCLPSDHPTACLNSVQLHLNERVNLMEAPSVTSEIENFVDALKHVDFAAAAAAAEESAVGLAVVVLQALILQTQDSEDFQEVASLYLLVDCGKN